MTHHVTNEPETTKLPSMSGEERRHQLVTVACELFASKGFRGTTTRQIATRAGVSEATLFKYFPTKKDLFKAILEAKLDQLTPDLFNWEEEYRVPPQVFLKKLVTIALREIYKDNRLSRLLMFSALENRDLAEIFLQAFACKWDVELLNYFQTMKDRGIFRRDIDPDIILAVFYGPLSLLDDKRNLLRMSIPPEKDLEKTADQILSIFFNGILVKE